jgi:hypothetical protein
MLLPLMNAYLMFSVAFEAYILISKVPYMSNAQAIRQAFTQTCNCCDFKWIIASIRILFRAICIAAATSYLRFNKFRMWYFRVW